VDQSFHLFKRGKPSNLFIMRILHTSDLHGNVHVNWPLLSRADVWLDTGDFFPNFGRPIKPLREQVYQSRWFESKCYPILREWLGSTPLITVPGNHDFVSLGELLAIRGHTVHFVTPNGFEFGGLRFAGFREINVVTREWKGEADSDRLRDLTIQVANARPDVLVTHAPPAGIITTQLADYGITHLANYVSGYLGECPVRHHFFGHSHIGGGEQETIGSTRFYNGACHAMIHDI